MGKSNKFSLTTKSHSSTRVNPYDKITLNALNVSCPDKQVVLPKLTSNGAQLIFIELYSLFIFIIALGTQYLNLYRSMWWLSPKARSQQSLNHHLIIDADVSQFSLIFIGQSSIIAILKALLHKTIIPAKFNLLAQYQNPMPSTSSTTSIATPNTSINNLNETQKQQLHQSQQQLQTSTQSHLSQATANTSLSTANSTNNATNLTTIVTATVSWICSYYLLKCAYRIWTNFGFHGLSFVSYPIVSIYKPCYMSDSCDLDLYDNSKLTNLHLNWSNRLFRSCYTRLISSRCSRVAAKQEN